jgi:calcineurin-like phosphoesterase family protein
MYVETGFSEVHTQLELEDFLLCHLPYAAVDARYPEWRPVDAGKWLLHGHVHEHWQVNGRMINVGVDQWDFAPVSLETVAKIRAA